MSSMISSNKPSGLRQGSLALAGILAAALSARAQVVSILDDFEAKSNQNKFLGYSYFYNDAADGGTSTISTSKPGATATELLVDPLKSFDAGFNSPSALKLDFTYGANKPKSCGGTCAYGQMVGFGTQLVPGTDVTTGDGTKLDMTGATAITFYAKASAAMKMRVEITTTNVKDFGYFRGDVSVGTDWTKLSVGLTNGLGGIAQPSWAVPVTFDPTLTQKLQFSISADDNTGLTAGTLWLDSIAVQGYQWVPPTACVPCVGTTAATGAVLGDLEAVTTPPRAGNQNAAGGFWFAYNDVGTRTVATQKDYSEIFEGVDATDPKAPVLTVSPAKGAASSAGAYIKFTLGPSYLDGANTVMPFVGIGTKTSDALETSALNATGSTGVAFDYNTDAASTFSFVRLEVKTQQTNLGPNTAAIHSVLVPATKGEWKTAIIPWAKFSLPDWTEIPDKTVPVDVKTITKFQWAVQDAPGTTGGFAIDNVKLPGMTTVPPISIRKIGAMSRGLRAHQADGRLDVAFELAAGVNHAKVSLLDMRGAVVASRTVSGKGAMVAPLETRALHSGLYTVEVRQGNVVRALQVTLLK
jgi:Carbohydrate binding domain (family 11)